MHTLRRHFFTCNKLRRWCINGNFFIINGKTLIGSCRLSFSTAAQIKAERQPPVFISPITAMRFIGAVVSKKRVIVFSVDIYDYKDLNGLIINS